MIVYGDSFGIYMTHDFGRVPYSVGLLSIEASPQMIVKIREQLAKYDIVPMDGEHHATMLWDTRISSPAHFIIDPSDTLRVSTLFKGTHKVNITLNRLEGNYEY